MAREFNDLERCASCGAFGAYTDGEEPVCPHCAGDFDLFDDPLLEHTHNPDFMAYFVDCPACVKEVEADRDAD